MLTLAHGHHGAALPPTRWLLHLHRPPASCPARRRSPCTGTECALRWGAYFGFSSMWAASGAASSPWACLRLPASSFLFLRLPAAAAAHAAAIPHTNWYRWALRWGTHFDSCPIRAASGAASSPWACLRLPASSFLFLRLPAAAAAHAAAIPHTNWCTVQTGVILEPLVLSEQRTVTYQRR
jgi:hypothetical protein